MTRDRLVVYTTPSKAVWYPEFNSQGYTRLLGFREHPAETSLLSEALYEEWIDQRYDASLYRLLTVDETAIIMAIET